MGAGVALSVLDQSPVISGGSPGAAIAATIELAVAAGAADTVVGMIGVGPMGGKGQNGPSRFCRGR